MIAYVFLFFVKQKTAFDMRISDWSSDVCSSDLALADDSPVCGDRRGGRVAGRTAYLPAARPLLRAGHAGLSAGAAVCLRVAGLPGSHVPHGEIGRASCRERVCQYV